MCSKLLTRPGCSAWRIESHKDNHRQLFWSQSSSWRSLLSDLLLQEYSNRHLYRSVMQKLSNKISWQLLLCSDTFNPYKNGIWNIKTAGKLKLSTQLSLVLEKDSESKDDYPPLLRLKDIIHEDSVDTFKAFLNPDFLHKNTQLRPFPTIETLQSDQHNDFYLTAVLNSAQKVQAESYINIF